MDLLFLAERQSARGQSNVVRNILTLLSMVLITLVGQSAVPAVTEIIIDNPLAVFVGSWQTGTSSADKYGSDYRFAGQNTTTGKSATYTPDIPSDGVWGVYTWYPMGTNRAVDAQYIIRDAAGDTTLYVNQQINGGKWNFLGNYSFTSGTTGYARITNYGTDTTKVVMADAIRFYSEAGSGDTDPPVIYPPVTASPGETTATITWTTNELATSQVEYGLTASYDMLSALDTSLTLSHIVNLSDLTPQTLYHCRVMSMDAAGNLGMSEDLTFMTTASEPPVISQVSAVPASSSAAVSWMTNEPATSQVEYGLTASYGGETAKITALTQSHTVTIDGLSPLTTYHYRVKSEDALGNAAVSDDYTFSTTAVIPGEFRGIWVDTWHQGILSSWQVSTLVDTASAANYNAIIPEIRKCGDAYYDSAYEPRATNIVGTTFDPLADVISKAHAAGVEVHPWIVTYRIWNTNWADPPADHIWALHPDWAMISSSGANSESGYYNLDPGIPAVQDYVCRVVMDIVGKYDIDGFEFDYIRYPGTEWGYNPITRQRFYDEYSYWPPTSSSDPNWETWCDYRRRQVTDLVKKCYLSIMAVKPQVNVAVDSIAWMDADPNTDYTSTQQYSAVFQDARTWMEDHIIDSNRLMNYKREHDTAQALDYDLWTDWLAGMQESTGRAGVDGQANYLNSITNSIHQMQVAREAGLGIANYSYAVTNKDGEPAADFFSAVRTNLYTTQVPTPDMPWKSSPTTGIIFGTVSDTLRPSDPIYSHWIYKSTVSIAGPVARTTETDATGTYGFVDLPPGTYSISVSADPYPSASIYNGETITAGQVLRRDFDLGYEVCWSPSQAKSKPDSSPVALRGNSVSAVFPGVFYLQSADRSSGIRVEKADHGVVVGDTAHVWGTLRANPDGERYIEAASVIAEGTSPVEPVLLINGHLGGDSSDWDPQSGSGQQGITGASGLNNIGLLVCTHGKVTQVGSDYLYLDDGSSLKDGTLTGTEENTGVRVICNPSGYSSGDPVEATGISSCFKTPYGDIARRVLTRRPEDLRKIAGP